MNSDSRIFVAGHRGMVGSALFRLLRRNGHTNLVVRSRSDLDLRDQRAVDEFFRDVRPELVFVAAGRVGGIHANDTQPADFLYDNIMIAANVIHAAARFDTKKLLYLGSSCVYPRMAAQPITEDQLLTGPLEPTNEGYAIAKIAGLKLCEFYRRQYRKNFISAMPTNLYGPDDSFDPLQSHVVPALMRRVHEAKESGAPSVTVWGTGTPLREFLHVDDLASALVVLMKSYDEQRTINIGSGEEVTIAGLADAMRKAVGYSGDIKFDRTKPDGTPRKALDNSRIRALGWSPGIPLERGLRDTYEWAVENVFKAQRVSQ